jgi:hypothetical protein
LQDEKSGRFEPLIYARYQKIREEDILRQYSRNGAQKNPIKGFMHF